MKFLSLFLLTGFVHAAPAIDLPWEWFSNPDIMSTSFERNFERLPLEASVKADGRFWSGSYWPLNRGNINFRWNANKPSGFNLQSPSLQEVKMMSQEELSELSPSEKYDLYTGRYDYPLKKEIESVANRKAKVWEGICHGWAPATMNHLEPIAKTLVNPDGVSIPFGSADIKALISYYYANGFETATNQVGWRCYGNSYDDECQDDLNAGAFHIILVNKIAFRNEGFIVDMKHDSEVWNHPINKYRSEFVKWSKPKRRKSAPGTVKVARVKTVVNLIMGSNNFWDTTLGTNAQKEVVQNYEYDLDIDANGDIIGGKWHSRQRPDFLWIKDRPYAFTGTLYRLGELLND